MAYIGHRCDCGHTDLQHEHDATSDTLGRCTAEYGVTCSRGCGLVNEPEVIPTFDAKGNRVERVIEPGDGLRSMGGAVIVRTCTCDACRALYEQAA
jgi:hypothetical protein